MDPNTLILVGVNLLALGVAFGSLHQQVKDLGRRVGRVEDKVNGALCGRQPPAEGPKR